MVWGQPTQHPHSPAGEAGRHPTTPQLNHYQLQEKGKKIGFGGRGGRNARTRGLLGPAELFCATLGWSMWTDYASVETQRTGGQEEAGSRPNVNRGAQLITLYPVAA